MSLKIIDREELFELIYQRFDSKEWWIIISNHGLADLLSQIEKKYYPPRTPANKDFEVVFFRDNVTIAFAKKSRMTFDQYYKLVIEHPKSTKRFLEDLEEKKARGVDVFFNSTSAAGWKIITQLQSELYVFVNHKEMEKGNIKIKDKKCQYHYSIPAELEGAERLR